MLKLSFCLSVCFANWDSHVHGCGIFYIFSQLALKVISFKLNPISTLLHSERPKLHRVLAVLSAKELRGQILINGALALSKQCAFPKTDVTLCPVFRIFSAADIFYSGLQLICSCCQDFIPNFS